MIRGSVQGVGFRMAAAAEADRLGVSGSARNRFDGTVEVEAEGRPDAVARMGEWVRRGPPSARVAEVDADEIDPRGDAGFRIA